MAALTIRDDAFEIPDMDDYDDSEDCPNCGGEGVIYMCISEYACVDPEGGCDLCERPCDWCRPRRAAISKATPPEGTRT